MVAMWFGNKKNPENPGETPKESVGVAGSDTPNMSQEKAKMNETVAAKTFENVSGNPQVIPLSDEKPAPVQDIQAVEPKKEMEITATQERMEKEEASQKADDKKTEGKQESDTHRLELPSGWEEQCRRVWTEVFRYGCLSAKQIERLTGGNDAIPEVLQKNLQAVVSNGETVFFHTEESIKQYSTMSKIPMRELKSKLVSPNLMERDAMDSIIPEIDLLLAFEKACKDSNKYRIFEWLSLRNARRMNRSVKIRRLDKRESLLPHMVVVFEKKQKFAMIFHRLVSFDAYTMAEKLQGCMDIVRGYDAFLKSKEKQAQYLKKLKLFYLNNIGVALYFQCGDVSIVEAVQDCCIELGINTPIFLAPNVEMVLEKPFGCWQTCYSPETFLDAKQRKKKE